MNKEITGDISKRAVSFEANLPGNPSIVIGIPGPVGPQGPAGPAGADGKFEDLTEEQKESLRGPAGPQGIPGPVGPQGPAGPAGADGKFEDLTEEQKESLRGPAGPAGPAGKFEDLTEEQKESLRGPAGPAGTVDKSNITVTLYTGRWSSLAQTVTASGVTASNTVIVSPSAGSHNAYCEAGVYCSAQASGKLTFQCSEKPTTALTVNVLIIN